MILRCWLVLGVYVPISVGGAFDDAQDALRPNELDRADLIGALTAPAAEREPILHGVVLALVVAACVSVGVLAWRERRHAAATVRTEEGPEPTAPSQPLAGKPHALTWRLAHSLHRGGSAVPGAAGAADAVSGDPTGTISPAVLAALTEQHAACEIQRFVRGLLERRADAGARASTSRQSAGAFDAPDRDGTRARSDLRRAWRAYGPGAARAHGLDGAVAMRLARALVARGGAEHTLLGPLRRRVSDPEGLRPSELAVLFWAAAALGLAVSCAQYDDAPADAPIVLARELLAATATALLAVPLLALTKWLFRLGRAPRAPRLLDRAGRARLVYAEAVRVRTATLAQRGFDAADQLATPRARAARSRLPSVWQRVLCACGGARLPRLGARTASSMADERVVPTHTEPRGGARAQTTAARGRAPPPQPPRLAISLEGSTPPDSPSPDGSKDRPRDGGSLDGGERFADGADGVGAARDGAALCAGLATRSARAGALLAAPSAPAPPPPCWSQEPVLATGGGGGPQPSATRLARLSAPARFVGGAGAGTRRGLAASSDDGSAPGGTRLGAELCLPEASAAAVLPGCGTAQPWAAGTAGARAPAVAQLLTEQALREHTARTGRSGAALGARRVARLLRAQPPRRAPSAQPPAGSPRVEAVGRVCPAADPPRACAPRRPPPPPFGATTRVHAPSPLARARSREAPLSCVANGAVGCAGRAQRRSAAYLADAPDSEHSAGATQRGGASDRGQSPAHSPATQLRCARARARPPLPVSPGTAQLSPERTLVLRDAPPLACASDAWWGAEGGGAEGGADGAAEAAAAARGVRLCGRVLRLSFGLSLGSTPSCSCSPAPGSSTGPFSALRSRGSPSVGPCSALSISTAGTARAWPSPRSAASPLQPERRAKSKPRPPHAGGGGGGAAGSECRPSTPPLSPPGSPPLDAPPRPTSAAGDRPPAPHADAPPHAEPARPSCLQLPAGGTAAASSGAVGARPGARARSAGSRPRAPACRSASLACAQPAALAAGSCALGPTRATPLDLGRFLPSAASRFEAPTESERLRAAGLSPLPPPVRGSKLTSRRTTGAEDALSLADASDLTDATLNATLKSLSVLSAPHAHGLDSASASLLRYRFVLADPLFSGGLDSSAALRFLLELGFDRRAAHSAIVELGGGAAPAPAAAPSRHSGARPSAADSLDPSARSDGRITFDALCGWYTRRVEADARRRLRRAARAARWLPCCAARAVPPPRGGRARTALGWALAVCTLCLSAFFAIVYANRFGRAKTRRMMLSWGLAEAQRLALIEPCLTALAMAADSAARGALGGGVLLGRAINEALASGAGRCMGWLVNGRGGSLA